MPRITPASLARSSAEHPLRTVLIWIGTLALGIYLVATMLDDSLTTKFEFINPHVLIYVAVADEGGKVVEWSGELTTPIRLARMDTGGAEKWSKDILQLGDEIMLSGNPARSGAPSLRLRKVIDSHGVALIGGDN